MMDAAIIRAFLVDDESLAVARLKRMLSLFAQIRVVGTATDPQEALKRLDGDLKDSVDVLFLDIQMPGKNGFELLASMETQPFVIFTTAFDEYALRAFQVNSIDYLVKPVESEQLQRAISKLQRLRPTPRTPWQNDPQLSEILHRMAAVLRGDPTEHPRRIATRVGERITFLDLETISHFLAQNKLTYAVVQGRQHMVDQTITELEEKLGAQGFLRIHRSALVSTAWIQEISAWFAGKVVLTLRDAPHTQLAVARDRVRLLKERMGI